MFWCQVVAGEPPGGQYAECGAVWVLEGVGPDKLYTFADFDFGTTIDQKAAGSQEF